jgi:hypothetical protein
MIPNVTLLPRVNDDAFEGMRKGRKVGVYRDREAREGRAFRNRVSWVPVVSVRRLEPGAKTVVYSLNVETHHTYITENRYVTGNCIYGWAGSMPDHFLGWDAAKQHIAEKSWRCAPPIMAVGERCLQRLPDYWDRGIKPAEHDGKVIESENFEDDLQDLDPGVETLVIARTNRHVARIQHILEDLGMPHRRVKAKDGAYSRDLGMGGLWSLQHGEAITGDQWSCVLEMLPTKTTDGRVWLERGSKAKWSKGQKDAFDRIYPEDLPLLGATDHLRDAITSGAWSGLPDGGTKWVRAAKRFGVEAVSKPKIRIGTVHSVKGQEASKVILLTSVGGRIRQSEEDDPVRFAEERRIEYVACTRAKHELVIAHDPRERFRMEIPV